MALSVSVWPCTQPPLWLPVVMSCVWALCTPFHWRHQCHRAVPAMLQSTYYWLLISLSTYWMWCFPPILLPRLGWGGPSINSIHSGLQSISIPTQTRKHHNSCVLLWAHPKAATGAPNIVTFLLFFFTVSSSLGPSSWSQDQKGSDLEQSMGVIIFLSDMGLLHWTKLYNRLDSPRKKASSRKGWGSSARSAQVHVNPGET